jgi:hypothetical protein
MLQNQSKFRIAAVLGVPGSAVPQLNGEISRMIIGKKFAEQTRGLVKVAIMQI